MSHKPDGEEKGGADDIVFECQFCGKSLVIDKQGAGLALRCPDCGGDISVPIPEGVDLSDIDQLDAVRVEVQSAESVPESPSARRGGVDQMITELEELRFRRRHLEKQVAAAARWLPDIRLQVAAVRKALDKIDEALGRLTEPPSDATRGLG